MKLEGVKVNVISSGSISGMMICISLPKALRASFHYVEPKGNLKTGFTLYASAEGNRDARKIIRRDDHSDNDEISLSAVTYAGVPVEQYTHRVQVAAELVEIEGVRAIQLAPFDVRTAPRREKHNQRHKSAMQSEMAFNSPRIVASPAIAAEDELVQLRRSVRYLQGPIEVTGGKVDLPRLWGAIVSIYKLGPKHHLTLGVKEGELVADMVVRKSLFEGG